MAILTMRDLFLYQLSEASTAEHALQGVLGPFANNTTNEPVRQATEQHLAECGRRIERLEQCFERLGGAPQETPPLLLAEARRQHEAFASQAAEAEWLMLLDLSLHARLTRFQAATYRQLVDQAEAVKEPDAAAILRECLAQEEAMAGRLESLAHDMRQALLREIGQTGQAIEEPRQAA